MALLYVLLLTTTCTIFKVIPHILIMEQEQADLRQGREGFVSESDQNKQRDDWGITKVLVTPQALFELD